MDRGPAASACPARAGTRALTRQRRWCRRTMPEMSKRGARRRARAPRPSQNWGSGKARILTWSHWSQNCSPRAAGCWVMKGVAATRAAAAGEEGTPVATVGRGLGRGTASGGAGTSAGGCASICQTCLSYHLFRFVIPVFPIIYFDLPYLSLLSFINDHHLTVVKPPRRSSPRAARALTERAGSRWCG
jgi:hypothetical protein